MAENVTEGELAAPQREEAAEQSAELASAAGEGAGGAEAAVSTESEGDVGGVPTVTESEEAPVDYEELMREDLATLRASFPELSELSNISELSDALRYAALRDMGLTAVEAYMASSAPRARKDNRAHLSCAVARGAAAPRSSMSHSELSAARELFSGMTDAEIHSLYKRVNG